jgi:hypothetical protein
MKLVELTLDSEVSVWINPAEVAYAHAVSGPGDVLTVIHMAGGTSIQVTEQVDTVVAHMRNA